MKKFHHVSCEINMRCWCWDDNFQPLCFFFHISPYTSVCTFLMKSFTFQFWIILLPQIPILLLLHTEGTRQVLRLQSVQEEQLDPGQRAQISWVAAHRQRCQARREFCMGGQHQSLNQWENILQRWCTQIITKTGFLFYRWVIWITEQTTDGAAMQLLTMRKQTCCFISFSVLK